MRNLKDLKQNCIAFSLDILNNEIKKKFRSYIISKDIIAIQFLVFLNTLQFIQVRYSHNSMNKSSKISYHVICVWGKTNTDNIVSFH